MAAKTRKSKAKPTQGLAVRPNRDPGRGGVRRGGTRKTGGTSPRGNSPKSFSPFPALPKLYPFRDDASHNLWQLLCADCLAFALTEERLNNSLDQHATAKVEDVLIKEPS